MAPEGETDALADAYLTLLAGCLTRTLFPEREPHVPLRAPVGLVKRLLFEAVTRVAATRGLELLRPVPSDQRRLRAAGLDLPFEAETMIGLRRLEHLAFCVKGVVRDEVPGDLIECGVWRGGASIFLRGALLALGVDDRTVWVADSFAGLPTPDASRFPVDSGDLHHTNTALAVSLAEVRRNFERYGLLDEQVRFLAGWFKDTLPTAPIDRLAVLRIDGDMYQSTWEGLTELYPKLSDGGYVVVDDYGGLAGARAAVDEYRAERAISAPITAIDWTGVFWRKGA